jgi:GTP-binding protein HflX
VSLVGYTNAGKSTLMNALADANVFAENRLFATLDATTRLVPLDTNKEALLSDTVGFIRKLPHKLFESFKSTLDEVRESDVLLHVVDVSHANFEDHIQVVRETLKELGALEKPTLLVFNKIDNVEETGIFAALRAEHENVAFVSAMRGIGLQDLKARLLDVIEEDFVERIVYLPVAEAKTIAHIHRVADVLSENYMYAQDGDPNIEPIAVARLHFRCARKYEADLEPVLARFAALGTVVESTVAR